MGAPRGAACRLIARATWCPERGLAAVARWSGASPPRLNPRAPRPRRHWAVSPARTRAAPASAPSALASRRTARLLVTPTPSYLLKTQGEAAWDLAGAPGFGGTRRRRGARPLVQFGVDDQQRLDVPRLARAYTMTDDDDLRRVALGILDPRLSLPEWEDLQLEVVRRYIDEDVIEALGRGGSRGSSQHSRACWTQSVQDTLSRAPSKWPSGTSGRERHA